MDNRYYKLYYGNFFNCSVNEKRKIKYLLNLRRQPLMTKSNFKIYLNYLFKTNQLINDFHYYLLSPATSDLYVDIIRNSNAINSFKGNNKMNKIPSILLIMWRNYEQFKNKNYQKDRDVAYDRGYYLHSDPILKKYDIFFRKNVSRFTSQLINVLSTNPTKCQRIIAAYLLGWSKNIKKTQKALEQTFINDPEHEVHNAAGRSLFPILLNKNKIETDPYLNLLSHHHTLCRNKACGILAFVPLTINQKKYIMQKASSTFIEMYKSPHPYNKRPVRLLVQKWKLQKLFKVFD